MAIYASTYESINEEGSNLRRTFALIETPVYGSSRVVVVDEYRELVTENYRAVYSPNFQSTLVSINTTELPEIKELNNGYKMFELTNHLGNVMAVVSDKRTPVANRSLIQYFNPELSVSKEYYPFGMGLVGFGVDSEDYRFGFNGQEKDDEIIGVEGTNYTAEFWQYDSRLGRRWNVDPVIKSNESPYATFAGNPIWFSDQFGLDTISSTSNATINPSDYIDFGNNNIVLSGPQTDVSAYNFQPDYLSSDLFQTREMLNLVTIRRQLSLTHDVQYMAQRRIENFWANIKYGNVNDFAYLLSNRSPLSSEMKKRIFNYRVRTSGARFQADPSGGLFLSFIFDAMTFGAMSAITKPAIVSSTFRPSINATKGIMNPNNIHFMQNSIRNITGNFTVLGNAEALANGTLNPDILRINIWKDATGKIWTLDHRRLGAFRLSGLQKVPIQWGNPSGQMWKMTTTNGGVSIKLKLGGGKNIIIK